MPIASYGVEHHTVAGAQQSQPGSIWPYSVTGDYGKKNSFRMSPYHRMDIGIQFHKKLKRCVRTFEFSVYNVYSRQNPFFYYINYDQNSKKNKLMQASLFPILPSVSWSYKF